MYYYSKPVDINSENIKEIKKQIAKKLKNVPHTKDQKDEFKMILQTYRTMHKNYDDVYKCFLNLSDLSTKAIFYLCENKEKETSNIELFNALKLTIFLGVQTVIYDLANKKLIDFSPIDVKHNKDEITPSNMFSFKISDKGIKMCNIIYESLSQTDHIL